MNFCFTKEVDFEVDGDEVFGQIETEELVVLLRRRLRQESPFTGYEIKKHDTLTLLISTSEKLRKLNEEALAGRIDILIQEMR